MNNALEPVLAAEDDPWRCDYCGESYQFQTHPGCLTKALTELGKARGVAREYYHDLKQEVGDYVWQKHYAHDHEEFPWLKESDAKP